LLFLVHAILTGISMIIMNALGARDGFTFSAGFTDWGLNFLGTNHEKPWLIFVVGPVFAVIYYFLFRFMIVRFDLKTPGREDPSLEPWLTDLQSSLPPSPSSPPAAALPRPAPSASAPSAPAQTTPAQSAPAPSPSTSRASERFGDD